MTLKPLRALNEGRPAVSFLVNLMAMLGCAAEERRAIEERRSHRLTNATRTPH